MCFGCVLSEIGKMVLASEPLKIFIESLINAIWRKSQTGFRGRVGKYNWRRRGVDTNVEHILSHILGCGASVSGQ